MSMSFLDEGEREILEAWSQGGKRRIARRAWVVLQELRGVSERRLSQATAIPSVRVQSLVTSYRRLGLLALAEAPRSGRPTTQSTADLRDQALSIRTLSPDEQLRRMRAVSATASGAERDGVWRVAREYGIATNRNRRPAVHWPCATEGPWRTVVGVAAGPLASVIAVCAPEMRGDRNGAWLFPPFAALLPALSSDHLSDWGWLIALAASRACCATPDKPRAFLERQRLWTDAIAAMTHRNPSIRIVIGGDPLAQEFSSWLTALRRTIADSEGRATGSRVYGAASFNAWQSALKRVLGDSMTWRAGDDEAASAIWRPGAHFWWVRRLNGGNA